MFLTALAFLSMAPSGTVIRGGMVYDGSGGSPRRCDVRIIGDRIEAVGKIAARPGDTVIDAKGLAVAPGFIDAHSHADGGIFDDLDAETQVRQGITTAVVGEDGGSALPIDDFFGKLSRTPAALNFATFVGQGSVRKAVMGMDERKPTADELSRMEQMVEREMKAGALGLSTGLEYEPGRYADTDELIELAMVASKYHGIYISHVRNEDNSAFQAFAELVKIGKEAKMPAEINHIKLCSTRVWHRAGEVTKMIEDSPKLGLDVTADVYPYLYWQSTIRVIIATEQFNDRAQWVQGLKDVGGPEHVLLTSYTPNPALAGKTVAQIAKQTGADPISVIQGIIEACYGKNSKGQESVVVTAMSEDDLEKFIACKRIMFCSDGGLHGSHPRGAGSFPRVLGVYVREKKVISLQEAIRKMTSLPASRFGFIDRGLIAVGKKADIVLFDPSKVKDTATTKDPQAKPVGLPTVIVNGVPVLLSGKITHRHSGQVIRRQAAG